MTIMIHREGEDFGPYTVEELKHYLADGAIKPTDLAWPEGGSAWVTVKQAIYFAEKSMGKKVEMTPPPAPGMAPVPPGAAAPAPVTTATPVIKYVLAGLAIGVGLMVIAALSLVAFFPGKITEAISSPDDVGPVSVSVSPSGSGNSNYYVVSANDAGGVISADMKTDYAGVKLRKKVLEEIYSLAKDSEKASKLKLEIHITGGTPEKNATIEMSDLEPVRKFADKEAYESDSGAKADIDAKLQGAGL